MQEPTQFGVIDVKWCQCGICVVNATFVLYYEASAEGKIICE